jgi:CubicO group peptidase (beta-lactamase class C family)
VLDRLAIPYVVDSQRRPLPSQYAATTITPAGGLISTVRDLAQFHLALRAGAMLRADTLAQAWQAPIDRDGRRLPHGLGWFVQSYNGETIAWQFGVADSGSSSLWVTVPGRGLTLILLANSNGLGRPFNLAAGDLTVSPFARLFLGLFVR